MNDPAVLRAATAALGDDPMARHLQSEAAEIAAETDAADPIAALRLLKKQAGEALSTEVALARTIARTMAIAIQRITLWGVLAILCAFVGLLALAVGLTIALAVYTGPLVAALVVSGILIGTGVFAALRARRAMRSLMRAADLAAVP